MVIELRYWQLAAWILP